MNISLFAALGTIMLSSGLNYANGKIKKGGPTYYNTDAKKKRKRKEQRAARRKNRK